MKRRLGAALLILAALCAVSTIVSEEIMRINERAESGVREAISLAGEGDLSSAAAKFEKTARTWRDNKPFLEALLHHESIEHAEEGFLTAMRAMDVSPEFFMMEADKLTATLHTLAEGDRPEAGNLF